MKSVTYKVFTRDKNAGNPAEVLFVDDLSAGANFEEIARAIDAYLTVFLIPKQDASGIRLRFFGRKGEMDFCGHGMLAAGYAYAERSGRSDFLLETNSRTVALTVNQDSLVQFITEGSVSSGAPAIDEPGVLRRLGISPEIVDFSAPFCVASIGSPKLLVPIAGLQSLWDLKFDLTALEKWSVEMRVNGAYFYSLETIDQNSLAHARAFNPFLSKSEDAGTGVAAGALVGAFKGRGASSIGNYVVEQGDAIGIKCRISVSIESNNIKVGGFVTPA